MVLMDKVRYKVLVLNENNQYKYIGSFADSSKRKALELLETKYKDKDVKIYKCTDKEEDVTDIMLK